MLCPLDSRDASCVVLPVLPFDLMRSEIIGDGAANGRYEKTLADALKGFAKAIPRSLARRA
jgi:hypothetical protein